MMNGWHPGGALMTKLSDQQISNIVFNETRSLSGPTITDARVNIAHAIINTAASSHRFPVMASAVAHPGPAEKSILAECVTAVRTARRELLAGKDPTLGARHFNFRKNAFSGAFQGHALKTSVGPLDNAYPTAASPSSGIYANTYE